eukprot:6967354-Prymnesium_polylepis.1
MEWFRAMLHAARAARRRVWGACARGVVVVRLCSLRQNSAEGTQHGTDKGSGRVYGYIPYMYRE